jgi:hypothetical protein
MTKTELIRRRLEILMQNNQGLTALEAIDSLIASEDSDLQEFVDTGRFFNLLFSPAEWRVAFGEYRNRLTLVDPIILFSEPSQMGGYLVAPEEDSCWGTYFRSLASTDRSEEDLRRILDEANIIISQFLPQKMQSSDRRGLVIGQVQSGKTTIFNGIISAAADLGFNMILVLSGTIESLRKQTQKRIAKDVTFPWNQRVDQDFSFTWISKFDGPGIAVAGPGHTVLPNIGNRNNRQVAIGVFLKNASVLRRLREFLRTLNPIDHAKLRVLIIDDECDQATPNAGVNSNDITAINQGIKDLILTNSRTPCPTQGKTCYLGFTATPFANLLNEAGHHTLYPKDFIYFLRPSSRYFGPLQLFGSPEETEEEETIVPLNVLRILSDDEIGNVVPRGGRPRPTYSPTVDDSLSDAIKWFILATAARRISDSTAWSTMLIHTSSKTADHIALHNAVKQFCDSLSSEWETNKALQRNHWKELWEAETSKVTIDDLKTSLPDYGNPSPEDYPPWNSLVAEVPKVIRDLQIKIDNSLYSGSDRLEYDDEAPADKRIQIAIGGNTLSRGLTLEGLISSYFARSTNAYDSLLQMGRWFGYRQGYELLPRLWTTPGLRDGFRDLVMMEQSLRDAMQLYLQGESPAEKAPVIRRMPSMAITRQSVLGPTVVSEADLSGSAPQTIIFRNDEDWLGENLQLTNNFLERISTNIQEPPSGNTNSNKLLFTSIPLEPIIDYLTLMKFWPNSNTFNQRFIRDFIRNNAEHYSSWSVVLYGGSSNRRVEGNGWSVPMNTRSRLREQSDSETQHPQLINLKALRATTDLLVDRPDLMNKQLSNSSEIWKIRRANNLGPVLIVYPIDRHSEYNGTNTQFRTNLDAVEDVIGLSIIMRPPTATANSAGVSLDLGGAYFDSEDDNPAMLDPGVV